MKLHERIKKCRLENNMTLLELANALGVREATAQRYESGEIKNLKHATVLEMSRVFNCSPAYLMGWDKKEPEDTQRYKRLAKYASLLSDEYFDKLEERAEELLALSEMKGKKEDVG